MKKIIIIACVLIVLIQGMGMVKNAMDVASDAAATRVVLLD